jgi:hypothetical protein
VDTAAAYGHRFYELQMAGSLSSAGEIVPLLAPLVQPRSVCDVGCGVGTWLKVWMQHGVADVIGIDGDHVPRDLLQIPEACFLARALDQPFQLTRRFDLVQSIEVAEHLPTARAAGFVADLVRLAPVVLFSAAIPGQGGTGHVNERWQDYWSELFRPFGYVGIDALRWRIWENDAVDYWYRQNLLIYLERSLIRRYPELSRPVPIERLPLRLVHPATVDRANGEKESLKGTLMRLPRLARAALRRRIGLDS